MLKKKDFSLCYSKGKKIFSKHFILFFYQHTLTHQEWRFGLAVSKKIGSAVVRNRVKRVLRDCIRMNNSDFPQAIDIVIVPTQRFSVKSINLEIASREIIPMLCGVKSLVDGSKNN